MKPIYILALLTYLSNSNLCAQHASNGNPASELPFKIIIPKKLSQGKICDSCAVDFAFVAGLDFSYILTGSGHTPARLRTQWRERQARDNRGDDHRSLFMVSNGRIGLTFLPNYLMENGKRTQIWRNYGGIEVHKLEIQVKLNHKIIKDWNLLSSMGEDPEYKIMGTSEEVPSGKPRPWKRTFHAGTFDLKVGDTLDFSARMIHTKDTLSKIMIVRMPDTAKGFVYYQIPVKGDKFAANLQQVMNIGNDNFRAYRGDTINVLEKDYNTIGILRFNELSKNDEIEYSFENHPFNWQTASTKDPVTGIFLVLPTDMTAGKDHQLFLRYKSQPETIHKVTISVKARPYQFPWLAVLVGSTLVFASGIVLFYLKARRNRKKLLLLNRKHADTESQLALLSGQLNPHFLFNTLHAIQGTINSKNPERANAYIGNVAGFMRDVMDHGRKEFVSLLEELKLEENYLKLEQQRLNFSYTFKVAADLDPALIDFPPLLLQPVLENSIRHAFDADASAAILTIDIRSKVQDLLIELSDNGSRHWDAANILEGHGLSLTRKRMAVYNQKLDAMSLSIHIGFVAGKGTITTFTFKNWLA